MSVNIIEGVIDQNKADLVINYFKDLLVHVDARPGFYEHPIKHNIEPYEDALRSNLSKGQDDHLAKAGANVSDLMHIMRQRLESFYGVSLPNGEGGIARLVAGASNGLHSDMYQSNGSKWEDGSNRESELEYSALLYLSEYNRDFFGGEIVFPQHKLTIEPKVGTLVFFRGDREHFHKVLQVTGGERHCIVSFFGKAL